MGISKEEALKKIQDSQDAEFEVFSNTEHKTFIDNLLESEVDKQLKPKVSEIHQMYDEDLYKLTGKRRGENQKTYDFLKETLTGHSANLETIGNLKKEIDDLKKQIKDGNGDPQLKKDLENVQKQYQEAKTAWDEEKKTYVTEKERMIIDNELDKALVGIKFKESIPESVRNVMVRQVKDNLIGVAKFHDGKLIFLNKDGETLRNKENSLNPYTAKEMILEQLKDIVGEEKKIEGTGVKPGLTKDKEGKKDIVISIPDSVSTKEKLTEHLLSLGLTRDSEEYMVAYAKYSPDLKFS